MVRYDSAGASMYGHHLLKRVRMKQVTQTQLVVTQSCRANMICFCQRDISVQHIPLSILT